MKKKPETIEKMREAAKRRWVSLTEEERRQQREKIAAGMRERWERRTLFERKRIGKLIAAARKAKAHGSE